MIPTTPSLLNSLANVTLTRDLARAIALYRRVLALSPNSAFAAYNLAHALNEDHAFDEAVEFFERAVALILSRPGPVQPGCPVGTARSVLGGDRPVSGGLGARDRRHCVFPGQHAGDPRSCPRPRHGGAGRGHPARAGRSRRGPHPSCTAAWASITNEPGTLTGPLGHFSNAKAAFRRTRPAFSLTAAARAMDAAKAVFSKTSSPPPRPGQRVGPADLHRRPAAFGHHPDRADPGQSPARIRGRRACRHPPHG
ncbi:tetratricopeptide repeat protein [Caulobacter segnis]